MCRFSDCAVCYDSICNEIRHVTRDSGFAVDELSGSINTERICVYLRMRIPVACTSWIEREIMEPKNTFQSGPKFLLSASLRIFTSPTIQHKPGYDFRKSVQKICKLEHTRIRSQLFEYGFCDSLFYTNLQNTPCSRHIEYQSSNVHIMVSFPTKHSTYQHTTIIYK